MLVVAPPGHRQAVEETVRMNRELGIETGFVSREEARRLHPLLALQVSVNRKDVTGKLWGPEQRINRREALYMYTRWAADYVLRGDKLGSIEPGKLADFLILSADFMTVPEQEIRNIRPLATFVGGRKMYSASNSSF